MSCSELTETLSNFLEGLSPEQLEYWNNLSAYPRIQQTIVDYLEANSSSAHSIIFAINAIQDLNNDECGILPTIFEPLNISAPYNPNLYEIILHLHLNMTMMQFNNNLTT